MSATSPRPSPPFINGGEGEKRFVRTVCGKTTVPDFALVSGCGHIKVWFTGRIISGRLSPSSHCHRLSHDQSNPFIKSQNAS